MPTAYVRPTRIISGGQTGGDLGGLVGATRVGIPTGGTAPRGFRTERGPQPILGTRYGLTEHTSPSYPPRTETNVLASDATVLFGHLRSPGLTLTLKLCLKHRKPYITNPTASDLRLFCASYRVATLNVAGNRESTNPGLASHVAGIIADAFRRPENSTENTP